MTIYPQEAGHKPRPRLRAKFEPAPGGGWDCHDATKYDEALDASRRASVSGHGDTKPEALADLIAALEDR